MKGDLSPTRKFHGDTYLFAGFVEPVKKDAIDISKKIRRYGIKTRILKEKDMNKYVYTVFFKPIGLIRTDVELHRFLKRTGAIKMSPLIG